MAERSGRWKEQTGLPDEALRPRADEVGAALEAALCEIAVLRGKLACAEEVIAELSEMGDAAQAAIDQLRARLMQMAARAPSDLRAVAAELYRVSRNAAVERHVLGAELFRQARASPPSSGQSVEPTGALAREVRGDRRIATDDRERREHRTAPGG
jgi:uncharacterized coiled-coil protein SlyX